MWSLGKICHYINRLRFVYTTHTIIIIPSLIIFVDAERSKKGLYLVFHADGYTTYEPEHCYTTHSISKHASDFVMNMKGMQFSAQIECHQFY